MRTQDPNYCLGSAGLAEGTNANTFQIANITHYCIGGRAYRKAVTDNIAFSAGHTALSTNQMCAFFVWLDTSGNVTTTQSTIKTASTGSGYVAGAWEWPKNSSKTCIGAIVVRTQNAATFTAGSTDLGATDVIDTFHNVADDYGVPITY